MVLDWNSIQELDWYTLLELLIGIFHILKVDDRHRHRFIEQSFRLCGRRRGWDVSREQHRNMYTIKGETDHRPRLDA